MPASFTLPSFAKINWNLRILGKRTDGFHELCTLYQTISLHDLVSFREAGELTLSCPCLTVPTDESNLIMKAARILQRNSCFTGGAEIRLEKNIPSPGGLGGGSSNAAVTLIGLARLWSIAVSPEELDAMAAELGSDVSFFLRGGTALGTGRGEIIEKMPDMIENNILIVTPAVSVATVEAFGTVKAPSLTKSASDHILRVCRSEARSLDPRRSTLKNDLETGVFGSYPEVERVKDTLFDIGALNVGMSGSGASVFAIFDNTETRQTAEKALDSESTWRKFAVSTVSRAEYRKSMHL